MAICILNGPNLNMLGHRESAIYGTLTLPDIETLIRSEYPDQSFRFFQSNHEGALVEHIHSLVTDPDCEGIVANFGAYTHTSVAIRDALSMLAVPRIEVHMSNIHAREEFRHTSITGGVCNGMIAGFGAQSYLLGIRALLHLRTT
jgi:3-dehydroquinate dehydratase-2